MIDWRPTGVAFATVAVVGAAGFFVALAVSSAWGSETSPVVVAVVTVAAATARAMYLYGARKLVTRKDGDRGHVPLFPDYPIGMYLRLSAQRNELDQRMAAIKEHLREQGKWDEASDLPEII